MSGPPHIEASIEFLTTEAGGRTRPAYSGYRPQLHYCGRDWVAELSWCDVEAANPGDTVRTQIRFMSPAEHHGNIAIGTPFLIREGQRTLAFGVVTEIFDQLECEAQESKDRPSL